MIMTPEQREQRKKQREDEPVEERTGRQSLALAHTVAVSDDDDWLGACIALSLAKHADNVILLPGGGRFERIIELGVQNPSNFQFFSSIPLLRYAGYDEVCIMSVHPWLFIEGWGGGLVGSLNRRIDRENIPFMREVGDRLVQDIDDHIQDLLVERVVEVVNGSVVVECARPICQSAAKVLLAQHEADEIKPIKDYENQNI